MTGWRQRGLSHKARERHERRRAGIRRQPERRCRARRGPQARDLLTHGNLRPIPDERERVSS